MNYWKENADTFVYVAAHRGWCSAYPENTMEAFKAAAELGVDQIETDIRITADGELVLIHDAAVDRTTDGTGLVKNLTLAQLRALDAGSHKGAEFKGCKIPTLTEFMDYVRQFPTLTLDLELKERPSEGWEEVPYSVCDRVLAMVEEYNFADRVVINTFSGKLHEYIQKKYGSRYRQHVYFPQSNLGECTVDPYSYAFCCCMFSREKGVIMATQEEFDAMRARGVEPWAGAGVKDEAGVDLMLQRGAPLVTCNNPDLILKLLEQKGRRQG